MFIKNNIQYIIMYVIRTIHKGEYEKAQKVFNATSDIVAGLGGFTQLEMIKTKNAANKPSLWVCEDTETKNFVGACMISGRNQSFLVKFGRIAVLKAHRRTRIASAMYLTMVLQGIVEGRRLCEDSIVGDNDNKLVLDSLKAYRAGELIHKTGSGKSIVLYQVSLMNEDALDNMVDRVPKERFEIHLTESPYTRELWEKNMTIYGKYFADTGFEFTMGKILKRVESMNNVVIDKLEGTETGEKRAKITAKSLL